MSGQRLPPDEEGADPVIRPFVLTRGRTASQVPIEALCVASHRALSGDVELSQEEVNIVEVCSMPQSVAEISAFVRLPLGVCRVLVGDLVERELVYVSQDSGIDIDLDLIGRLLDGIRRA